MTKKFVFLLLTVMVFPVLAYEPQTGDIIFQMSRSSQSKAIQQATHSRFSHTATAY